MKGVKYLEAIILYNVFQQNIPALLGRANKFHNILKGIMAMGVVITL
jgi:hypothetical protein